MTQITAPGPETAPGHPPHRPGRRGIFARIGAVTVAAAAASVLAQQKAQAASSPFCCYGLPSCNGNCTGATGCCWYCCYNSYLFRCCDNYSNGTGCICAFTVSRC